MPGAPRIEDFDYELPDELVAQQPLPGRSTSRLMVVDRATSSLEERRFSELPTFLRAGDVIVRNDTRVVPAKIDGVRVDDASAFTAMLYEDLGGGRWKALVKPAKKLKIGTRFRLGGAVEGTVLAIPDAHVPSMLPGERWLDLGGADVRRLLEAAGSMPLPPYVKTFAGDPEQYQTTYARRPGAVSAPTAGFHFTPELFSQIAALGVEVLDVTLHVGPGTFQPVRTSDYSTHRMLGERYEISADVAARVAAARAEKRRVIAVGSTSLRTLETAARDGLFPGGGQGSTDLYCTPGYAFRAVDAMITNFHLPRTTLLLLVMAFGGEELMKRAYSRAVADRFRFYSFGDAMFIK